jgi:hypothetical protein
MLLLVRRWQPERRIVAVADGGYASLKLLDLLDRCQHLKRPITFIHHSPEARRRSIQTGSATQTETDRKRRPRLKGERLPTLSAVLEDPKTACADHGE